MRQNYINFPITRQTGLSSGSTQTVDAFNQVHATVWFYCFIILGMTIILFINLTYQQYKQIFTIKESIRRSKQPSISVHPYIGYDNWLVEFVILIIPFLIVILICLPSTALSYSTGEVHSACASLKITGQQWSWQNDLIVPISKTYGYRKLDFNLVTEITKQRIFLSNASQTTNILQTNITMDRMYFFYILVHERLYNPHINHITWLNLQFIQTKILPQDLSNSIPTKVGNSAIPYMYDVTNISTAIPTMVWSKLTVDATDVIHSYWLWDFGIKIDCIPGNPLQIYLFPKKFGISTGNCAEYCGNGHINMPITVKCYDVNQQIQ